MGEFFDLPPLYLASQSPRRKQILADLGIKFEIIQSPYQEKASDVEELLPVEQAGKLAAMKAFHAAGLVRDGLIIGADTIVVVDRAILGKPKDREDARQMLEMLSGTVHKVITGISIVDVKKFVTLTHSEITKVYFRKLAKKEIDHYVSTPEPYDKAGAYAVQGIAGLFVEKLEGCYYNVVGFPVVAFSNLLKQAGYDIFDYIKQGE
ncbi:MAG: septum formation protein Maf [Candidatus Riflebacteria bacterium]|nr:septum formation protein Maf [Candidatus Riflebacteria bacterium]